jgi:arylsulfatase A-like enzyme
MERVRMVLFFALAFAIGTGALHVVIAALKRIALHDFIWMSRDFVWMTPLAYVVIFLAAAIPLALLAAITPRLVTPRVAVFLFSTLAALAILLLVPRVHHLALLLLAVGVGAQLARTVGEARSSRHAIMRRATLATVTVLGLVALGVRLTDAMRERQALASLPPAPASTPSVLLIVLDTVRAASMSFQGYSRATTPSLAQLGARGVIFEHAYSPAPWTLPAHASMFTGHNPGVLTSDWQAPLDTAHRTLAEAMRERGYRTVGFTANHYYTSWESGLTRGFDHFEDYFVSLKQALLGTTLTQTQLFWSLIQAPTPGAIARALARLDLRTNTMSISERKLAARVIDDFLRWQAAHDDRPFFAFLNLYDAHLPYEPPRAWATKFSRAPMPLDLYDASIAYMDHELGRLFGELAQRGVLDRTLVIVTSDHGEGFGEHGLYGHGNSLYLTELHVPLLVRFPAHVPAGRRVDAPVTLRDLAATVLDLTGVPHASLPGASLARAWEAASGTLLPSAVIAEVSQGINTLPHMPVSRGPMQSLIDREAHYIRNGDGIEELYAYRSDPLEMKDLTKTEPGKRALVRYREMLRAALDGQRMAMRPPRSD